MPRPTTDANQFSEFVYGQVGRRMETRFQRFRRQNCDDYRDKIATLSGTNIRRTERTAEKVRTAGLGLGWAGSLANISLPGPSSGR